MGTTEARDRWQERPSLQLRGPRVSQRGGGDTSAAAAAAPSPRSDSDRYCLPPTHGPTARAPALLPLGVVWPHY